VRKLSSDRDHHDVDSDDGSQRERLQGAQDASGESRGGLMDDVWNETPELIPSIGGYLMRQRELRGISREELCTLTRIPMRSLERLESGSFDNLTDGFVRGFVRTVASALGLDPDDTLARMTQEPHAPAAARGPMGGVPMLRIGVITAALVLVLIGVGLVRVAVQYLPGQDASSDYVLRTDPVRALAEERGMAAIELKQALVEPMHRTAASANAGRREVLREDLVLPPGGADKLISPEPSLGRTVVVDVTNNAHANGPGQ
jgi:hypothetical protein